VDRRQDPLNDNVCDPGYPAPLKNAIDHLYRKWACKPALIVSYGSRGGDKCPRRLREILTGLNMRLTVGMPGPRLSRDHIVANYGVVDPKRDFAEQVDEVDGALRELAELRAAESTA
jgi:NAD(P)H-dependent FMN reductase